MSIWRRRCLFWETPLARIGRRLKLVGAEYAQLLTGARYLQDQCDLELWSLKIRYAHAMQPPRKIGHAAFLQGRVHAVVVDDQLIVDVKLRAVVRQERECVESRIGHPELSAE